ncbi:MAG: replication-associated recombination protein A [Planctomycetota bacterium]|jgi:putative ATPase|nr:replication-associated recombination protein A [Planctomycetota bacterium]
MPKPENNCPESNRPPLAERMRPANLDDFQGQEHLVGPGRLIRQAIEADNVHSMILWGPPGSGKTTLARVIAKITKRRFVIFSAVLQGVKEVRAIVEEARERLLADEGGTILFVDEIHRFNRGQQDAFLPHVEAGTITLIGATTENPSFEVNGALLSRCRTYVLRALSDRDLEAIVERALGDAERGLGADKVVLEPRARELLINYANGDARAALNALETAAAGCRPGPDGGRLVDAGLMREALTQRRIAFDNRGEEWYNLISALHKSLRGSDPQAGLYWLARMLEGGADPLYLARRLIRFASEDVGLADPGALVQAVAAKDAVHFLGMPEADNALAQAVVYLATAPKSNRIYAAYSRAVADVAQTRNDLVPPHIRNAPTKLMRELGYGRDYQYDPDAEDGFSGQEYLPEALRGRIYYQPGSLGFEKDIQRRIDYWNRLRRERRNRPGKGTE